jgi:hypothetical protein
MDPLKISFDNTNNYNNHHGDYFWPWAEGLTLKMQNMLGVLQNVVRPIDLL